MPEWKKILTEDDGNLATNDLTQSSSPRTYDLGGSSNSLNFEDGLVNFNNSSGNTKVQINANSSGNTLGLLGGSSIQFGDADDTHSCTIDVPSVISTTYSITLPDSGPDAANRILESDASGNLSWIATPSSSPPPSVTINNNADNRIITGSGTANTLNAEANLTYSTDLEITSGEIKIGTNNKFIEGKLTGGASRPLIGIDSSDVVVVGNASADAVKLVGNTELAGNVSFDSSHGKIACNPSLEIVLDDSDNTADASTSFLISDNSSTDIFKVLADGTTSGLLTTTKPTVTGFQSSYQQGSSATGTVSNFSSTATYVGKVYNSSGTEQTSNPVTIDSSGNISFTAPSTVATGYELRIYVADVGELKSTTSTTTFEVTQTLSFTYWRLKVVDSSGNNSNLRIALVELEYYTGQNQTGTETPTSNATSNTSISGVTISAGYTTSSYYPWKAFDGTLTGIGSAWWSLGVSNPNNWIQLRFSSAQTFQSLKLIVNDNFNYATHFQILGSNTGAFSGEEITALDTTAISEGSTDTSTTVNF